MRLSATCALIEALNTTPGFSRKTTELIDLGA